MKKNKILIIGLLLIILLTGIVLAQKNVTFIVTGNVRAEFNLCG
jgi:hypothetical protein